MMAKRKNNATQQQQPQQASDNGQLLKLAITFAIAAGGASQASKAASDRTQTVYAQAVTLARQCKDGITFDKVMADLYERIQTNVDDLAVKCGAKATADGSGYKVPQTVQNARNVLGNVYKYGLDWTDADGASYKYGQLRAAQQAAREAETVAKGGDDALRIKVRERFLILTGKLKDIEGDSLTALARNVGMTDDQIAAARGTSKGSELADAADSTPTAEARKAS